MTDDKTAYIVTVQNVNAGETAKHSRTVPAAGTVEEILVDIPSDGASGDYISVVPILNGNPMFDAVESTEFSNDTGDHTEDLRTGFQKPLPVRIPVERDDALGSKVVVDSGAPSQLDVVTLVFIVDHANGTNPSPETVTISDTDLIDLKDVFVVEQADGTTDDGTGGA